MCVFPVCLWGCKIASLGNWADKSCDEMDISPNVCLHLFDFSPLRYIQWQHIMTSRGNWADKMHCHAVMDIRWIGSRSLF